jgi:DNA (cytosine-5)-methyltransferase 1
MKLLDLFCGAGGCAVGYYRAGFYDITGVDIAPQKNYPYKFIQGDALAYLAAHGHEYDFIHASPPCQAHTRLKRAMVNKPEYFIKHLDLIPQTRELLQATGKPYVIENVPGAPLEYPLELCGAMFGLKVYRHRLFETSMFLLAPSHIPHHDQTPPVGRGASPKGFISVGGNGGAPGLGMPYLAYASKAMGIEWMNRAELSQAIPPAYTEWIGQQYLQSLA